MIILSKIAPVSLGPSSDFSERADMLVIPVAFMSALGSSLDDIPPSLPLLDLTVDSGLEAILLLDSSFFKPG